MRVRTQKEEQPQRRASRDLTTPCSRPPAPNRGVQSILHLQRTAGNQALLRLLNANAGGPGVGSQNSATTRPDRVARPQAVMRARAGGGGETELAPVVRQANSSPPRLTVQLRRPGEREMGPDDKRAVGPAGPPPRRDIDAGLPPVPATPPHGGCGPDMTQAVGAAVENTHRAFGTWSTVIKDAACTSLRDSRLGAGAWDIMEINRFQIDALNSRFRPDCAWSPPDPGIGCGRSIEIFPGCYYSGSANYVIFGHMFRICHDHYARLNNRAAAANFDLADALFWAEAWKSIQLAENTEAAEAWTRAGYNNWRPGGAQPVSDRPACWPTCSTPYAGDVLEVHWGPRYFRDGSGG